MLIIEETGGEGICETTLYLPLSFSNNLKLLPKKSLLIKKKKNLWPFLLWDFKI